jgi:fermentation-respiration switch protein FrsA (DUF1100 family)
MQGLNLSVNQPDNSLWQRSLGRSWRIVRLVLLAYLFVLLAMVLLETWLVYPVPPITRGDWNPPGLSREDVWFKAADGTQLHGWFIAHPAPKRAILYCHGNGEHIAMNAGLAARLRDELQASVFTFDYRGYGHSEGRPDEAGCVADGQAAQRWLADRMRIRPNEVVLMGRSLGGGVAVALAADQGAAALVLEATFPTMCDVAASLYPWLPVRWCIKNQYDSLARIRQYDGPLMQCHGANDRLIPSWMGRQLFDASTSRAKRWIEFPGLGHNSDWPPSYYASLAEFLDSSHSAAFPSVAGGQAALPVRD